MSKFLQAKPFQIQPGGSCQLSKIPTVPEADIGFGKKSARARVANNAAEMADLARRLYAENRRSVLLVLQGMDTAGKDGTIRSVMSGMNPTSCQVHSFKTPTEEELDHDFLWRCHQVAPRRGNIAIFNRSHYEDVLIVRVHHLQPESRWSQHYELINDFEKLLSTCDTTIVKCFLHISKDRQRQRLQQRVDDTTKHWKFNVADLDERKKWDDYQTAYEVAIEKCNTAHAPWFIIPSDKKWYRNLVISELLKKTLQDLQPNYPAPDQDYRGIVVE